MELKQIYEHIMTPHQVNIIETSISNEETRSQ